MTEQDWMDRLIIITSIISPIMVLVSTIFAAKSARAAEKAANLSLKMYQEQKEDQEKALLPLFEAEGYPSPDNKYAGFRLLNRNNISVAYVDVESEFPPANFKWWKDKAGILNFGIERDFRHGRAVRFTIIFNALNHHQYTSEIEIKSKDGYIIVTDQKNELKF